MTDPRNRPDYKSKAYKQMAARWPYVCDPLQGTLHLRSLAGQYLPRFPAEDQKVYEDRLSTAVFFNALSKTLHGLVGMIFRKEPTLSQDVPQIIKDHLENVDLAGKHWTVFAKQVETNAAKYGHSLILVDMPPALGSGATLDDERRSGRRPYWVQYTAEQAINWRTITVAGKKTLSQITFEECSSEADGEFGEAEATRYRVLRLTGNGRVEWHLKRKQKAESGEEVFVEEDRGLYSPNINEIPVAVVYGREEGNLISSPPLLDLAMLNLKHYQQRSEFDNTLHIVGFPMLWTDSADDDSIKAVGPSLMIRVPKGSQVGYAEPTGASLEAQRLNLEDLKKEMAIMGLSFLAERAQVEVTATEAVIDNAQEESELATMARSAKDAFELCLGFHAQYLGMQAKQGGSIEMATAEELTLSAEEVRIYSDLVMRNQLDLETLWAILQRASKLPADFDAETVKDRLGQLPVI